MKTVVASGLLVCFLLALSVSAETTSDVLELTQTNFDAAIKENELIFVEFYAPWCGHCKKLVPEYEKAATALKGKVPLAKVDATVEKSLAEKFNIEGFPTMKLFRNGQPIDYAGGRTSTGIVSYLERQIGPAAKPLASVEAVKAFVDSAKVVVVGFFSSEESAEAVQFKESARLLRDDYFFGYSVDAAVASSFGFSDLPKLVVFKKFDDGKAVFSGEFNHQSITSFVFESSFALVDEITSDNYLRYVERQRPIVWLFLNLTHTDPAQRQSNIDKFVPIYREAAQKEGIRDRFSFVFLDGYKYEGQVIAMGLSAKVYPALAIQNQKLKRKYVFPESQELTADSISAFVNDYEAERLNPWYKSQPVPAEPLDKGVRVVVGSTFEKEVIKSGKDVLIEFYAPWCGHCKNFEPTYAKMAQTLSAVDSLVVAKMDATANDVAFEHFETTGYPTFFLVRADKPLEPILYDGGANEKEILEFISTWASKRFDLPVDNERVTEKLDALDSLVQQVRLVLKQNAILKAQVTDLKSQISALQAESGRKEDL